MDICYAYVVYVVTLLAWCFRIWAKPLGFSIESRCITCRCNLWVSCPHLWYGFTFNVLLEHFIVSRRSENH